MVCVQASVLESRHGLHLTLNGVSNSKKMLIRSEGIDPATWKDSFDAQVNIVHEVCWRIVM